MSAERFQGQPDAPKGKEIPQRGDLYYLWHPETLGIFSGYGLVVETGKKEHLVGLLMVGRPKPADPAWLSDVQAVFGSYELVPMTQTGERGIICQMIVANEALSYLRHFPDPKSTEIKQALSSLLEHPPQPRFRLTWNQEAKAWQSSFYLELPPKMREVFEKTGPGCFAAQRGDIVAFVTYAKEEDIASFQGQEVLYRWDLYKVSPAPILRLHTIIMDDPYFPFRLESFFNIGDKTQKAYLTKLTQQETLPFDFFGEDFTYRYTKAFTHPPEVRQILSELIAEAEDYWNKLPPEVRNFDRAKALVQQTAVF